MIKRFIASKNVLFDAVSIGNVDVRDGHYYGFWLDDTIDLRGIEKPPITFKVNFNLRRSAEAFVMVKEGIAYVTWMQYTPEYFVDH